MNAELFKKAFEIGVREALEFFRKADTRELRKQMATSANIVLEAATNAVVEVSKTKGK